MNAERITIEVDDHVADVRLVRSDKHNALDWEMITSLGEATDELTATPGLRAVVLSGEGPSFCSGLDFPSFIERGAPIEEIFTRRDGDSANLAQRATYTWQRLPVPVVAALHGACFGGGAQLALAADIRLAAPDTRISVMEIRYGLIPDMGISRSLPRLVGIDVAKELVLTGRIVEADEAMRLGLVTRIADDPHAAALELAREIAAKSPHAIRAAKRLLDDSWGAPAEETLRLEETLQRELLGSPNQLAAVQSVFTQQAAEFADLV